MRWLVQACGVRRRRKLSAEIFARGGKLLLPGEWALGYKPRLFVSLSTHSAKNSSASLFKQLVRLIHVSLFTGEGISSCVPRQLSLVLFYALPSLCLAQPLRWLNRRPLVALRLVLRANRWVG